MICSSCQRDLPITDYHKNRANKSGHHRICRTCRRVQTTQHIRRSGPNDTFWCPRCAHYLARSEFHFDRSRTVGVASYCKSCSRILAKSRNEQLATRPDRTEELRETTRLRCQRWRDENREKYREYQKHYQRTYRKLVPA